MSEFFVIDGINDALCERTSGGNRILPFTQTLTPSGGINLAIADGIFDLEVWPAGNSPDEEVLLYVISFNHVNLLREHTKITCEKEICSGI